MVVVSRCFFYGCVVIVKVLVLVMVIIIVKLLCFLFMNVTCNLNNFINSVAESVSLTLVFLKGMASVNCYLKELSIATSLYRSLLEGFLFEWIKIFSISISCYSIGFKIEDVFFVRNRIT